MYERPKNNRKECIPFEAGIHQAMIERVYLTKTKSSDKEMFKMKIVGLNNQSGFAYLVFGTSFTKDNLNYLLASIDDNGTPIPNLEFGYTQETADFITGKKVFIEVKEQLFNGRKKMQITAFLTYEEIDSSRNEDVIPSENKENRIW